MKNKNVLVTGSNGQLGSELRVAISDQNITNNYLFTDIDDLDITNKTQFENYISSNNIDVIVNCAAYTHVDKAEDDKDKAELVNHKAVQYISNACKKNNVILIHISTDYVFDGSKNVPYTENDDTHPTGVYGATKLSAEQTIIETDISYFIFRTSWLYSSYGNNFVKTIDRLSGEKSSLNVVFDQVGTPTYAADLAKFILYITENDLISKVNKGIYHFSNEGICSWFDFATEIVNLNQQDCAIRPVLSNEFPTKANRPAYSVLNKSKTTQAFDYEIPYWRFSLNKCMRKIIS